MVSEVGPPGPGPEATGGREPLTTDVQAPEAAPADVPTGVLRQHLLHLYDLDLLANAGNYDLRVKAERKRSVRDLERLFFEAVRIFRPELFIEAGAKEAGASRRARGYLPDARVVAFEGNPYVHQRFREQNDDPRHRLEYLHLALSDAPGRVSFHVRRRADGTPVADGRGSLKERSEEKHGTIEVDVECTTLDTFFADQDFDRCVLWIDVEGAADKVLTGGREVLSKAAVVFIEVEDRGDWVWGPAWTVADVSAYLFDLGLVPVGRDYQTRYQYNVVYVARDLLNTYAFRARLAAHRSAACRGDEPVTPVAVTDTTRPVARARRLAGRVRRRLRRVLAQRRGRQHT